MADLSKRLPENVAGRFYVDEMCIDCELCRELAPGNFTRQDSGKYSYVNQQPTDSIDLARCSDALEQCPVEAIGNDG